MFFQAHRQGRRPIKVVNTFTQLSIAMVLVCAMMRKVGGESSASAVVLTFIFMRVIQVFFNVLESFTLRSGSKGIRIGLFLIFLIVYVTM